LFCDKPIVKPPEFWIVSVPVVIPFAVDGRKLSAVLTTPLAVTSAFEESAIPLNLKLAVSIILYPTRIIPSGFNAVTKPKIRCA
jgi:hypothetical protein